VKERGTEVMALQLGIKTVVALAQAGAQSYEVKNIVNLLDRLVKAASIEFFVKYQ
jgi:hypothetical protein